MALQYKRRTQPPSRQKIVSVHSIPAPIGGLNAVDALASMPETDALTLENYFPQPSYVQVRGGSASWSTGLPAWVETLMDYRTGSQHNIFAISGTAVYDVTTAGAVGAAVVTGLSNAQWEWTDIATPGGQFLYAANAVDDPLYYNGSAWTKVTGVSTPAITGVTTTLLRNPTVWRSRLWFIENSSTRVWYLPINSIGGAASKLDFAQLFTLGGTVQAIVTLSLNDGSTFASYIGFLSSEGELLLYRGTDPDFSSTFSLQGIYRTGRPIGRRCWFSVGPDAIIICSNGFQSVTKLVQAGDVGEGQQTTISYKILNLVNQDVQAYASNFGWEGKLYPLGNKILINVPQTQDSVQYQYVMNTLNGSWCKFTGWNGATFLVSRDTLYYGGNGVVIQADTGNTDLGASITGYCQPAFSYMGYQGPGSAFAGATGQKRFTMLRPIFASGGVVSAAISLNTNFNTSQPTASASYAPTGASVWNVALWNVSFWSSGTQVQESWQFSPGIGFSATAYIKTTTSQPVSLYSIDYVLESGGIL